MSSRTPSGAFFTDSESISPAKRRRSDCHSPPSLDVATVEHPKPERRRVNPETLAQKLGPQVVADLQACITPGMTEMPSFEIRKRIQQRYNIDRRHIYDWFHAMGLRVVKDEKSNSSKRADESRSVLTLCARRNRQPPIRGPITVSCAHSATENMSSVSVSPVQHRRRKTMSSSNDRDSVASIHSYTPTIGSDSGEVSEIRSPLGSLSQTPGVLYSGGRSGLNASLLHELPTLFDDDDRLVYPDLAAPVPSYPLAHALNSTLTVATSGSPSPGLDENDNEPLPEPVMKPITLEDLNDTFPEPSQTAPMFSSDLESSTIQERQETYSFISDALGLVTAPDAGATPIQEAKGSYQAYKQDLSRIYYGKILDATDRAPGIRSNSSLPHSSAGSDDSIGSLQLRDHPRQLQAIPPTATQWPRRIGTMDSRTGNDGDPTYLDAFRHDRVPPSVDLDHGMVAAWVSTDRGNAPLYAREGGVANPMFFDPQVALTPEFEDLNAGQYMMRWYNGHAPDLRMLPTFEAHPTDPRFYLASDPYYPSIHTEEQYYPEFAFQPPPLGDAPIHMPMTIRDGQPFGFHHPAESYGPPVFPADCLGHGVIPYMHDASTHFYPHASFLEDGGYRIQEGYDRPPTAPLSKCANTHEQRSTPQVFDGLVSASGDECEFQSAQ
ncbi:hypothetical protein PUNSTDRAFT_41624 [Punctularia strigosozonata HHB-11173 SS5]|uniref:uncharacterized protein n=1 Tax=Punctularia strigosozonata (strain HHB-11173) TaxID=741275 RepID=UPI0004416813|nr:uncharacterized protein PUNSTDRAFT_41624 [Punctularia strigosozonata HHB-11173 SS5]EIN14394.1 hypothetical protein PUNSTDRAFT_41624 [Punctularia strigosozonata HHB-11173 SS5]